MKKAPKTSVDVQQIDSKVAETAAASIEKMLAGDEAGVLHGASVLEALKAIKDAASPPSAPPRWPPMVIFTVTALLMAYLLGKPDSSVVAFDVSTRALDIKLSAGAPHEVYVPFSTSRFPVRALLIEGTVSSYPADLPLSKSPGSVSLANADWKSLTVEEIQVAAPAGKDAPLIVTTDVDSLRLCSVNRITIQTRGSRSANPDVESEAAFNVSPAAIRSTSAGHLAQPACVTFALDETSNFPVTVQLPVSDISVSGPATNPQGIDPRSTLFPTALVSGKLTFPEVPSAQFKFGADERLGLTGARGILRAVDWKKGQMTLKFRGTAVAVTRSTGQIEQKLIPSRLSHLRASQSELILGWGVLLYLFGLVLAVYKWIGERK